MENSRVSSKGLEICMRERISHAGFRDCADVRVRRGVIMSGKSPASVVREYCQTKKRPQVARVLVKLQSISRPHPEWLLLLRGLCG